MMFINVAAEAITAIMMTSLLFSDEFFFIWIFEQPTVVGLKIAFDPVLFVVIFIYVAGTGFVAAVVVVVIVFIVAADVLVGFVAATNPVIGSSIKNGSLVLIIKSISSFLLNLSNFWH